MTTKRLAKGVTGAVGGATGGILVGFIAGASGSFQFSIPVAFLFGILHLLTGGTYSSFVGVLISVCFGLAVISGIGCALFYGIGGAVAGSTWGKDDK